MNFLQERILRDGVVKPGNILKVDSFLNHQMDIALLEQLGQEFHRRFADCPVTKVLTIETSGIAVAYPVARALPVLLIAGITPMLYPGRYPSVIGVIGLLIVCCGCLLMPLKKFTDFSLKNYFNMAMWFIVLAAIGTTGYTINDSELVKICADAPGYDKMKAAYLLSFVINLGLGMSMGVQVIFRKEERENFKHLTASFKQFIYPAMAGILSSLAYALILLAMTMVPQSKLSFLQAFRQMSLPIGLMLGIFILKEPPHRPKLAGVALIVSGLVLIALFGGR